MPPKFGTGLSCATALALAVSALMSGQVAQARVTKIVIDQHYCATAPCAALPTALTGGSIPYESYAGRAYGQLDPNDPHNEIITDINKGMGQSVGGQPCPSNKVCYVASFYIVKPVDMSKASGLMWHDVPNRGGRITIAAAEQALGDVGLSSGWQADQAGATVPVLATATSPGNDWVMAPIAKNRDGSSVTGNVMARIVNRSGPNSAPLNVMGNPVPYWPATLDTTKATLVTHTHETTDGVVTVGSTIPSSDWRWATCSATNPFPGTPIQAPPGPAGIPNTSATPNPLQICLKNGFDPKLLYQVVYPATNAYLLGVGHAAFRDVNSFFMHETKDDAGTASPLAGAMKWSVIRGVSQSGNMTRAFIHLGFNEDEAGRRVHDGAWPIIAGRRVAADMRWGQPDGVLELYQMGYEGPQWWADWPDFVRHLPTRGILDRCSGKIALGKSGEGDDDEEDEGRGRGDDRGWGDDRGRGDDRNGHHKSHNTCPKIIEHFGSSEVWALKMTTSWVGTFPVIDIPLPSNVRRYYIGSTTHGGGGGGFSTPLYDASGALQTSQYPRSSLAGVNCPGNNWGTGLYPANPVPEGEVQNALRISFRNWVMKDQEPLPSMWPRIDHGQLADANSVQALGFPSGIPGVPAGVPGNGFIMPGFLYGWGPHFNQTDATGVPTVLPPPILKVVEMLAPKVDSDGNEIGGVPQVLRDAPLGTYLGWNVTANTATNPFYAGEICNYIGGWIPFAATKAERTSLSPVDPRPSLEERYCSHAGYVSAVTAAVNKAVAAGYLLQADGTADIAAADASGVCGGKGGFCNPANTTCTPPKF